MEFLACKKAALQLQIAAKLCSKYWESPIRLHESSGVFFLDRSWKTKIAWSRQFCTTLLLLGFMTFRLVGGLRSDMVTVHQVIFMQLFLFIYVVTVMFHAVLFFNGDHIVSVLNMAIFFQDYEVTHPQGTRSKVIHYLTWILRALRYSFMATGLLYLVVIIVRIDADISILSALPGRLGQICLIRCAVVLFYAAQIRYLTVTCGFLAVHMVVMSIWIAHTLKHLRKRIESVICNRAILENSLRTYMQLRLLTLRFNQSIAILLPAVKLVCIVSAILSMYAVVKLSGVASIFSAVYAMNVVITIELYLRTFADIHCESDSYLKCLRGRVARRGVLGKKVNAAMYVAIEVAGRMHVVDKQLMLTVLQIIVVNAVSLMLAT